MSKVANVFRQPLVLIETPVNYTLRTASSPSCQLGVLTIYMWKPDILSAQSRN